MREIKIGDVTINSIVERDGPWRKPEIMFPAFDPVIGHRHLAELPIRSCSTRRAAWW